MASSYLLKSTKSHVTVLLIFRLHNQTVHQTRCSSEEMFDYRYVTKVFIKNQHESNSTKFVDNFLDTIMAF